MTDAPDLTAAAIAFADALPSVEFRPNTRHAPRRNGRGPTGIAAAAAVVAAVVIATTVVLNTGSNARAAWSATPSDLSSAAAGHIDQKCRAADASGLPGPNDQRFSGAVGGAVAPSARTIGDLPLILIDARGSMAIALYGNAQHHILCTLDPQGAAMVTPDSGAWPVCDPISSDAGVVVGSTSAEANGVVETSVKLLGAVASDITAITVDIPGVGSVTATVAHGDYALFVPQNLVGSSTDTAWTAHVTKRDGSVQDVPISGFVMNTNPDGSGLTMNGGGATP